jgi:5-methyltetrahydrofolate--homocysteine methyltransferase
MQELINAMAEMQEGRMLDLVRQYLAEGRDPVKIFSAYQEAMLEIGRRFAANTYFIPELILSGEMMKAGAELIKPYLSQYPTNGQDKNAGKFLLATIEGDIHDIGKNIVGMMMGLSGFEVMDLGIDVPGDKIIATAESFGADIIGISGLLTLAFNPMKHLVEKLKAAGVRNRYKVIVGGAQLDQQTCDYIGADAFATDVMTGVKYCKQWMERA